MGTATTAYLYDGANFVQELSEANTTAKGTDATQAGLVANLITAGIDATHLRQRLTATGTSIISATPEHQLADADTTTIALANQSQSLTARYNDTAYGETKQSTFSGTGSSTPCK